MLRFTERSKESLIFNYVKERPTHLYKVSILHYDKGFKLTKQNVPTLVPTVLRNLYTYIRLQHNIILARGFQNYCRKFCKKFHPETKNDVTRSVKQTVKLFSIEISEKLKSSEN